MRVGTETTPSTEYLRGLLTELYGSQSDRVVIGLQAVNLICLQDPSIARSSEVWLTSPIDNQAVSNLRILRDATNTTSLLSQRLCGILEAYQIPQTLSNTTTSLPSGVLPTVDPPQNQSNISSSPTPPTSGGSDNTGTIILVLVIVVVSLCCISFFLWRWYKKKQSKKEDIAANDKQRELDFNKEVYPIGSPGSQAELRESGRTEEVTENPLIGNFPVKEISVSSSDHISVKDSDVTLI